MNKIISKIRKTKVNKPLTIIIIAFGVVGSYLIFNSFAATAFLSIEPEQGNITGPVRVVEDRLTSGSKSIMFGSFTTNSTFNSLDLSEKHKKDIAMQLVSSAENSSLNWKAQYNYIEDIGDGRGYTGGIVGFTSGTHDMLQLIEYYKEISPSNILVKYLPALRSIDGTSSHEGLGTSFVNDWKLAVSDSKFIEAQDHERDRVYFDPAVEQGKKDGLRALGQFIYYDALVMHGPGSDSTSFDGIRLDALKKAKTPAQGGEESAYLNAFLDSRRQAMLTELAHDDTSRVDTEQRLFVSSSNFDLAPPLNWKTYGESYSISAYTEL